MLLQCLVAVLLGVVAGVLAVCQRFLLADWQAGRKRRHLQAHCSLAVRQAPCMSFPQALHEAD